MKGIIFKRSETSDASLLIRVLLENGKLQTYKIPGVFKSKKRSSFFMAPATIWNFTTLGSERDIIIPKEYTLHFSPLDFQADYARLALIAEAMTLLQKLKPEADSQQIFEGAQRFIESALDTEIGELDSLVSGFFIDFLAGMGLLHAGLHCIHCGVRLSEDAAYHLFSGSACGVCLKGQSIKEDETLPNLWVIGHTGLSENKGLYDSPRGAEYRKRISRFLNAEI